MKILSTLGFLFTAVALSAQTTVFVFSNGFSSLNENPPIISLGSGTVNTLLYDAAGGTNGFGSFTVDVSFTALTAAATNAHIHGYADPTANAGPLQLLSFTPATSGSITGAWDLPSQLAKDNLFGGLTYINLHSSFAPGGELRGQLAPVPEPAVMGMALGAVALGIVLVRRRRRA